MIERLTSDERQPGPVYEVRVVTDHMTISAMCPWPGFTPEQLELLRQSLRDVARKVMCG